MLNDEINIAIAERCGMKWYQSGDAAGKVVYLIFKPPNPMFREIARPAILPSMALYNVPIYTDDLEAMWAAEEQLTKEEKVAYGFELYNVIVLSMQAKGCRSQEDYDNAAEWIWHAT